MSDNLQHIDVDSDEYEGAPKALRDYVKKLQKQNEGLRSDLGQVRGQLHSRAVGDVLAGKGFKNPEKVKRDLLADGIDPLDTGAVEAWLSDNEGDYAKGSSSAPAENPVNDERAQAQEAINGVLTEAHVAEVMSRKARADAEIDALGAAADGAAVLAIYAKHGV